MNIYILALLVASFSIAPVAAQQAERKSTARPEQKATPAVADDTWQCKDKPLPPGFEIVREINEASCHDGRANVIRRSGGPSSPAAAQPDKPATADSSVKREEIYSSARPVGIIDVATDQKSYVSKYLKITGLLSVSSYYDYGYRKAQSTHLAFTLKDSTGSANVYIRRGDFGESVREQILQAADNRVRGTFVIRLNPDRYETTSDVFADLILVNPAEK